MPKHLTEVYPSQKEDNSHLNRGATTRVLRTIAFVAFEW